jgi:serpin B
MQPVLLRVAVNFIAAVLQGEFVMLKKAVIGLLVISIIPVLAACEGATNTYIEDTYYPVDGKLIKAAGDVIKSDTTRLEEPLIEDSELITQVDGNNDFAFNLYRELGGEDQDNLLLSPYSVTTALAMLYAGARENTQLQMKEVLKYQLSQSNLAAFFNYLDSTLEGRGKTVSSPDKFSLKTANAVWGQVDYEFLEAYLDVLAANYDAGLRLCDFEEDTEGSRLKINDWVAAQTENRIQNLLAPGSVTQLTRLILTNAVYFKSAWDSQFTESLTGPEDFSCWDEHSEKVDMMRQSEEFKYLNGSGYQAVELPYAGREMAMMIILPDSGNFSQIESNLDAAVIRQIADRMEERRVNLTLPKFEANFSFSLNKALIQMGMTDAFKGTADFSGIDGKKSLFIDNVVHKTFIKVDEYGTEAAAATAVIMTGSAPGQSRVIEMKIDRPFIYLIRDIQTNQILFLGRVVSFSN